ncbi:hypothetical protein AAHA92_21175 [Salvia divinorum]|uniref:Plant Basic Secretory Protein n=1 Tax=Salvia divinorum TaxID=28513 RepID=A0ABD1GJK6_SALDI
MNRSICIFLIIASLLLACLAQNTRAVKYVVTNTVPNTPGGQLFDKEIGVNFTLSIMPTINEFIYKVFEETSLAQRRNVPVLNVYISEFPGYAYKNGDNINISASALDNIYRPRSVSKRLFTSLMYHEMTHVFQWHACLVQNTHATRYVVTNTVPNTPGGQLFDKEIGVHFTLLIMPVINEFIYKVFEETTLAQRRHVPVLNVYISEFPGYAYKNGDNINISASALDKIYRPRSVSKRLFTSLMYHEMTHVFQWHGNFGAPGGLTEGTADYVMVKSRIYDQASYTKPGAGKRWDEGYGVTEKFLEYCDSLLKGFTAQLNKKMQYTYSDKYWVELLGKPVDQLWREYKAKYGNKPQQQSVDIFQGISNLKHYDILTCLFSHICLNR